MVLPPECCSNLRPHCREPRASTTFTWSSSTVKKPSTNGRDTDSLYGSRHLAAKWSADGTNRRLKGLINVDMTGDKNLHLVWDENSTPSLRKTVWDVADSLGYTSSFPRHGGGIEDDHMPFIKAGVRSVDMIDFDSQSTFWHTPQDTMDKLDPHSFDIVGAVVLKAIEELEQQK